MSTTHFNMKIVKRSKGESAIAAAAYQSGEKLYSERDSKTKHYSMKQGIVSTEVIIPSNAPEKYKDRNTLWNAVEKVEKQWNSQLARRFIIGIPKEIPENQYSELVHEYCMKEFVEKGMCCDIAIHEKYGGERNPHAHILLTLRPMDKHGNWTDKSHKVYDLDEFGERIKLSNGEYKSHKVSTTGWDEQSNAEAWRHDWETIVNEYLERAGSDVRIDMRSYERQGKDQVPTVHMGPAVTNMERRGIQTDIGNLNRDIKAFNSRFSELRRKISGLKYWISHLTHKVDRLIEDIRSGREEVKYWVPADEARRADIKEINKENIIKALEKMPVIHSLTAFMNKRTEENRNLPIEERMAATRRDQAIFSKATQYVTIHKLSSISELDKKVSQLEYAYKKIGAAVKYHDRRLKEISMIETKISIMRKNQTVVDELNKKRFKKTRSDFYEKHKPEIDEFYKAKKYLEIHNSGRIDNISELNSERKKLQAEKADLDPKLAKIEKDLEEINAVKYCVDIALERVKEEPSNGAKDIEKDSVLLKIQQKQEEVKKAEAARKQNDKSSSIKRKTVKGEILD